MTKIQIQFLIAYWYTYPHNIKYTSRSTKSMTELKGFYEHQWMR